MKNILSPLQIEQIRSKLKKLDDNDSLLKSYREVVAIHEKFIAKVSELDDIIKNKVGPKGNKGDPGPKGDKGDAGDIRNIDEVISLILSKIPKPEDGKPGKDGLTPKKGVHYFTQEDINTIAKITSRLIEVPSIQEKEIDPMKIIEAIEKLPEGKKLSSKHIDGLEQTISAIRNQTKRGYLHGGGDTVVAGTNITITKTATGTKIINATGGGGIWYQDEIVAQSTAGTSFNLAHTPTSVLFLYKNGQYMISGVGKDYIRSGVAITLFVALTTSDILTATYS